MQGCGTSRERRDPRQACRLPGCMRERKRERERERERERGLSVQERAREKREREREGAGVFKRTQTARTQTQIGVAYACRHACIHEVCKYIVIQISDARTHKHARNR